MKKQILKRILSSISATTLAVTSLGLNTVLAANAESAAPAAQTKEHTEAADHVHDDCCGGCCGEEAPAGQGVTIALLDAGVTNYETAGKTSFIDDDTIDSDHGNDMMSILKDTAPGADVLDVRVLDDEGKGTYANVEKGIRWAVDNSADIIVMSFVGDKKSALLENALTYAEEHEVLVVASAGNYSSEKACYPAAYPTVISVGALDENGNVQDYSNFGDYVDTFVEWSDGTSGAAQNVAAFAAITMQQSPEKSASDIRETYVADKSTSFEASKEDNADTVVYAAKCTSHRYKFKMTARAATCTTGGVEIWVCANYGCSASQTRNTKALGHNAGSWTREKNPTCTATGSDVRKCTRCNAVVNRRTLSALGHNPGNWTREKNPTCTATGSDIRKCTRCGAVVNRRTLSALGHNPGNWTREKNPTCTATGSDIRKCTRCGAVVNRRTLSALGHNPGNWTREKNPTCTANGSDIRKCTRCGAVVNRRTLSALGHNPGNWTREKNPTCTANGSDIRKCTRCNAVVNRRTLSALGHNPGNWTREKNPTCTVDGSDIRKCTRCKAIVSRRTVNKLGHNPGNWTREKNPTCTVDGSDIRKCTRCKAIVSRRTVNKLGHNPGNWTREKNPTCTVDGSDIRKCTRCKAIVSRRTVNKLGHNPGNWIREKNPTCTTNGSEIRKCIRCGAVVSRRTIAAPGHYFKFKQTAKPATCTTGGVEIWACTRSGCKATQTRNTKALGHAMSAWTTTPATCTSPAIQTRKCTRSGCTYKETRKTGSALGHAMSAWTTTTPATCTSPAIQTRKCTRKNCTYKETRKSGSALGHNFKLKQVAKPATCTTGGVEIWACTRSGCKATQTRNTKALGHAMSAWTTTTPATCTSPAIQTRKCTRSGCTYKETRKSGSALGHNFKLKQVAKPATCTTGGVEIWACTRSGCKATQTRNTKALGHSYKWVVTKQPTCTATGVKQYKCSRSGCGHVANSAAVPALGHNFKLKQVVKQATCTTAGVEIWACTRSGCKATQTKNIKALGHDLTAWKVITPATTTKEGKKERSCKRSGCKYKETAVIPKIGTLTIDDCGFKSFNFVGDGSLEEGQHSWPLYYDAGGKKYLLLNFETNTDWSVSTTQSYVQILDKNLKKVTSGKAGKNTVLVAFTSFPVTSYDLARTASITFKANTTTKSYSLRQSNFTINGLEKKDYINQSKIASYIKELGANSAAAKALKGEGTIGTMSVYSFGDHRRIAVSNRKTTAKTIQIEYAVFKAKVNQGPNENEVEIELMDTNGMKLLQNGSLLTTTGVINSDYKHVYDEVYAQHEKNASMFTKFVTNAASLACSYFLPISNKLISFGVGYGRGKLISGVGKLITNCVFEDNGNNTVKTTSTVSLCDGCSFTNNGDSVTIYISNTSNTKCSINLRVVDSRGNSTPVQYNY